MGFVFIMAFRVVGFSGFDCASGFEALPEQKRRIRPNKAKCGFSPQNSLMKMKNKAWVSRKIPQPIRVELFARKPDLLAAA
jgi:hypothetical protein